MTSDSFEPGEVEPSDESTSIIANMIMGGVLALRQMRRFTTGDVMSACMHITVEAGMQSVEGGQRTREELIVDLQTSVARLVAEFGKEEAMDKASTHDSSGARQ